MRKASILCLITLLFAGCAHDEVTTPVELEAEDLSPPKVSPDEINEVIEKEDSSEAQNPRARATPDADEITATLNQMPVEINAAVKSWIEYFTVKDRERFARFLERGERYRPMVTKVLREEGLPEDLYYLALIESGYATAATSRARAVGIWQFISGTGHRYGLRVDSYVDERRDPRRATVAAALYLRDLHNVFQSWYLAMAAYNAGESRIMNAIMAGKSRNFWELVKRKRLPLETMDYIPKFLAAVIIGHNPERYGFRDIKSEPNPEMMLIKIPSPVRLNDVARITGVSYNDLKKHNPQLLRGTTPMNASKYGIWVPKGLENNFAENAQALQRAVFSAPVASASSSTKYHRVRRGENLHMISAKYRVPVDTLRRLNNIRSNYLAVGRRLKLPAAAETRTAAEIQRYRVKHGDNLHTISKKFKVSVPVLKQMNKLKRNTIYVGQVLKVANSG